MPTIVPGSKPRLSAEDVNALLRPFDIDRERYPVVLIGIRGYYLDMGAPGRNDRGIYDDALFIDSPSATIAYNANTDPARVRIGHGTADATKGMARLKAGAWFAHRFGNYKGRLALKQVRTLTVIRDGQPDYEHSGLFGIHIHIGGRTTTSSIGCTTIPPDQWPTFIANAVDQAKRYLGEGWNEAIIPYLLVEMQ